MFLKQEQKKQEESQERNLQRLKERLVSQSRKNKTMARAIVFYLMIKKYASTNSPNTILYQPNTLKSCFLI